MTKLYDKCCQCVDSVFIDWEKTRLSTKEKRSIEEYEVWGIVHLALYVLDNGEYIAFKRYIYEKHGYDPGGVLSGQIKLDEILNKEVRK